MTQFTRLYNNFQPEHYDIYLDINRETKQFNGKTKISGNALVNNIALHQKNLQIQSVHINEKEIPFVIDDSADLIKISTETIGQIDITVIYKARLTDTMMGIYPSYYELDGVKKQIIGTQFETSFARQAFPSVDEPEAKATFDLSIKFDEQPNETIIANMPEIRTENGVHYFDTTVRMSTYLVAFAFGELQSKQTVTNTGVKVGVFSTKAHAPKELDFALDIAKRSIEFFEDFYQTPYPLPHSWQLALPDFSAGAMENWGLVTYREAYVLLDPENAALNTKQIVATVIAHELAHQWFGDLVTMKWWDDLWLNESFANMMEYVAINDIEPDWHIWESFQTSDVVSALKRDSTDGVQSVHTQVEHPADIDALFDPAIVYAKGARLLVMVRSLIGDKALREGLKRYFARHRYANAAGADLWEALGEASGQNIKAVMDSWLEQPGYPVVLAKVIDGQLTLSQEQFFIGEYEESDRQWQIPLNSNYDVAPQILASKRVVIGDYARLRESVGAPFRLNDGNDSHFIVKYDAQLLTDILEHLDELDNISQRQILQDLHLLADGRQLTYADIVPILVNFAHKDAMLVNAVLYGILSDLKKFVTPNSAEEKALKEFYDVLSRKQVKRLGWAGQGNESYDDQLTRPYVLNASLYAENPDTIATAHELFEKNSDNLQNLSADIRHFVLANELKHFGTSSLFDQLLTAYRKSSDANYKADLRSALTSTSNPDLIVKLIDQLKDADTIKPQDLRGWVYGLLVNDKSQQLAWNWVRDQWQWLEDTIGGDMEFTMYITVIAAVFHTPERLAEFKSFFEPKLNTPGLTREITMDIKVISSRVDLIAAEKDDVNMAISEAIK
ncbi:M1 family metallopeptidase [Leuconostoc suionicum]|uniref:M1 family metallopeptidase n=1 Tax=Leuconostoc suionicum TaxID=1511761 RepID=UPI001B8D2A2F|nr:M1 family metallopeptidase [Leuconostoc suionicum]MBS1007567.1 M1 family metallopeptidase [Leuconostoc suionicum]